MIMRDDPGPVPSWWSRLVDQGVSAAVFDVPKSPYYPTEGVDEVVDWMAHGADSDELSASSGPLRELCESHRPHGAFRACYAAPRNDEEIRTHVEGVQERREAFTAAVRQWVGSNQRDLTLVVYASSHCLGHRYPPEEAGPPDRVGDELEALDRDLGELIEAWGGDPGRVLVFSLLGLHAGAAAGPETAATVQALNRYWLRRNPRLGLWSLAKRLKARLRREEGPVPTADAFTAMKLVAPSTAVRLNLIGRERRGIVPPERREELIEWLVARLSELVDDDGEPVLAGVVRAEDAYPGERHDALGDVFAIWRAREPGRVRTSVTTVTPANPFAPPAADHQAGGWLVTGAALSIDANELPVHGMAARFGHWLDVDDAAGPAQP